MFPQPQSTLDPKVKALASAIRRTETGTSTDPYNAKGASGESGAYQFMPDTWKGWSKEFLGHENAPMTVENQNKVAYERIKRWKDEGYNPAQIASLWNTGSKPNAYKEGFKGVNDQGVEYDVPAYVEKVSKNYREVIGGVSSPNVQNSGVFPQNLQTSADRELPSAESTMAPVEPEEEVKKPLANRIADFLGYGKTTETIGKLINRAGLMPQNEGQKEVSRLTGKSQEQINEKYIEAPTGKEVAGAALNVGSLVTGLGGLAKTGAQVGTKGLLTAMGTGLKTGLISGGAVGAGQALEDNKSLGGIVTDTAIGATIEGVTGGTLPAVGQLGGLIPAAGRATKNIVKNTAQGAENIVAKEALINSLPSVEQRVLRAGLPDKILALKNTTPQTQSSFSEMLNIHKRGLADGTYARNNMVKQVPARTFLNLVEGIQKQSTISGNNLRAIAAMNPTEKIDFVPAFQVYIDRLAKKGVRINPATGKFMSDGRIPDSEMKYYDDILREIQSVVKDDPNLTRAQAHTLRQRLFATLDSATRQGGKPGQRPYSIDVDNDVQAFRREIAGLLGTEYQQAASTYAQNEKILSEVAKMAGTTIDEINTKDRKLGEVFIRTLGNASDRPQSLIDDVVEAAKRNGVKNDVDINAQIEFADLLEKLYGSTQSRTMAAQVRQGVREGVADVAPDIATGNITQAILKSGRQLIGKGEEDQIKALEAFINSMNQNKGLIVK